ncbi:MAG: UDP-N-acetyl glucosamine 2-epimerase, partial [Promethearchaeota archaeon]
MKVAPFIKAIENYNRHVLSEQKENDLGTCGAELINPPTNSLVGSFFEHILVHTGQHYDAQMSMAFFEQLEIPEPDIHLGIGSGSHAEQVGNTMIEFEKVIKEHKPDWVVVVGDVNATLACSLTAKKELIRCCHIEAGLRSSDMTMPEEINRIVTDRISDLLLTPDLIANENLRKEGIPQDKIRFVGNIMIDTLEANREKVSRFDINQVIFENLLDEVSSRERSRIKLSRLKISENSFGLMTLHRPSNVDYADVLGRIVRLLVKEISNE